MHPADNRDPDRFSQPLGFVNASLYAPALLFGIEVGQNDESSSAPGDIPVRAPIEYAQFSSSSMRFTGRSGCTVEIACL